MIAHLTPTRQFQLTTLHLRQTSRLPDNFRQGACKAAEMQTFSAAETWPSGRRRSPAKGVGGLSRLEGSNPFVSATALLDNQMSVCYEKTVSPSTLKNTRVRARGSNPFVSATALLDNQMSVCYEKTVSPSTLKNTRVRARGSNPFVSATALLDNQMSVCYEKTVSPSTLKNTRVRARGSNPFVSAALIR